MYCLGFKKEWFSFFFSFFFFSSRGRAKALCFGSIIESETQNSSSSSRKKKQKQKSRGALSERFFLCVCGSDDGGGGVRDILSLVVVEKKHINTKSNCVGLERELDRIW